MESSGKNESELISNLMSTKGEFISYFKVQILLKSVALSLFLSRFV